MVAAALALMMVVAAPPVPPVPTSVAASVRSPERGLASWMPGEVRCDGGAVISGATLRRPLNAMGWRGSPNQQPVTLRFAIDSSGRPVSIAREDRHFVSSDDIAPALAASRFPAKAQTRCAVTYSARFEPFATAPLPDLVSYSISPLNGRLPAQGWQRIQASGDCAQSPRPQPLIRVLPDFEKLRGTPGVRDWALIGYDTDASGKPLNVRVQTGTGNAELDKAAVKAMQQSRFTGGARTGCVYPYWRAPDVMPAPPMPEESAFHAADTCAAERKWVSPPVLRFPPAYNRRKIEGWAVVRYDVAPWGAIGNAKVLDAQPSEDFGQQALQVIQSAKVEASPEGRTGCIGRIRFVMNPTAAAEDDDTGQTISNQTIFD